MAAKQKSIITKLLIDEVSAVDEPAQEGARVVLIKRKTPKVKVEHGAMAKAMFHDVMNSFEMPDAVSTALASMWVSHDSLRKAVGDAMRYETITDKEAAVRGIVTEYRTVVEKLLGDITDAVSTTISKRGNSMNTDDIKKVVSDIVQKAFSGLKDDDGDNTEVEKVATDLTDKLAAAIAEGVAKATADAPTPPEEDDDSDKTLAKRKGAEDEGDTYTDVSGRVYKRSDLGASYDHVVELAKRADESDKRLAAEVQKRHDAELVEANRAAFPHLPGDYESHLAVAKMLEGLPEKSRDGVHNMLKSASAGLSILGREEGREVLAGSAEAQLQKLAADHQANNADMTIEQAYLHVISKTAKGAELYEKQRAEEADNPRETAH